MAYKRLRKTLIVALVVLTAMIALGTAAGFLYDQAKAHGLTCADKQLHAELRKLPGARLRPPGGRVVAHADCTVGTFGEGAEDSVVTVYETKASSQEVITFYTTQLGAMGWRRNTSADSPDGTSRGFERSLDDRGHRCTVNASATTTYSRQRTGVTVRLVEISCDAG